ncbi:MAG: hypothetical protein FJZ79_11000 [Chlorobi bacterium]|nr:hypothetical protein [Chlorobiota bacterium]
MRSNLLFRISLYHFVVILLLGCDKYSLSDGSAKKIIENEWAKSGVLLPMSGNFTVISGGYDWQKGTISKSNYKELVALDKLGLVEIMIDENYERYKRGDYFSWSLFLEQLEKNVVLKIAVSPTEKGQKYVYSENLNWLKIPMGTFSITDVLRNEKKEKGVDLYRILMIKYDANWSDIYRQYIQILGGKLQVKRKAVVLLKWDSFDSKWIFITSDIADENDDFVTKNVEIELKK